MVLSLPQFFQGLLAVSIDGLRSPELWLLVAKEIEQAEQAECSLELPAAAEFELERFRPGGL